MINGTINLLHITVAYGGPGAWDWQVGPDRIDGTSSLLLLILISLIQIRSVEMWVEFQ